MTDAATDEDVIICAWCEKPGADEVAETIDEGDVPLHRYRCAASWAWARLKERMH